MERYKSMVCILFAAMFSFSVLCSSTSALTFIRGDADSDGVVTVIDATTIQKEKASIPVASFDEKAADVDGDGVVSVLDATYIQKSLAHIETDYAVGETVYIDDPTEPQTEPPTEPQTQAPTYKPGDNELPFIPNR